MIAGGCLQVTKVIIDGATYASVNIDANGNTDRIASFKQAALVRVDNFEEFANSQFWMLV